MNSSSTVIALLFFSMILFVGHAFSTEGDSCISSLEVEKVATSATIKDIREEASKFLAEASTTGVKKRLSACPISASSNQSILDKLNQVYTGLKGTKCQTNHKELMESIGSSLASTNNILTHREAQYLQEQKIAAATSSGSVTHTTVSSVDPRAFNYYLGKEALNKMQTALSGLSTLVSKQDCSIDIRTRGLIPVIADTITNISQVGLYFPAGGLNIGPPYALGAAMAGTAIGSIMKIVHALLIPAFDWRDYDDRKQFVDLVCSFYKVRVELEDMQFFRLKSPADQERLLRAQKIEAAIDSQIKDLETAKISDISKGMGGLANNTLLTLIPEVIKKLSLPVFDEKTLKANELEIKSAESKLKQLVPSTLLALRGELVKANINPENYPLLDIKKDIDLLMDDSLLSKLKGKSADNISNTLIEPLIELQAALESDKEQSTLKFKEPASYKNSVEDLLSLKARIQTQKQILERLIAQKNYIASDEGAFTNQSIIESFHQSQDIIFGKTGNSFFNFILSKAVAYENTLVKSYHHQKLYNNATYKTLLELSNAEKKTFCSNSYEIIRQYHNSEALLNIGTDFLDSNADIFYNSKGHKSSKFSSTPLLLKHSESLLQQRENMADPSYQEAIGRIGNDSALGGHFKIHHLKWKSSRTLIGEVIDLHEKNRPHVERLQQFMHQLNCGQMIFVVSPS
ncbi:MAG: hypothetical protein HQK50_03355 [Oligoflexia bacterium]|nr:hypothetical protein [Oligoflexia bacterium]MBF0364580.1 hypothetical protein [Oligoflexia bacterium]